LILFFGVFLGNYRTLTTLRTFIFSASPHTLLGLLLFKKLIMVVEELNFSFITTSLAAFAKPTLKSHFQFLREQNISTIISLTENPIDAFDFQFEQFHIPITDFTPPTIGQINEAVKIIESARSQKKITGIHCAKGRGRAGTIAASYLVYLQHLSADESIEKIRKLRPGSIETIEQEVIIKTYQISLDEPKSS